MCFHSNQLSCGIEHPLGVSAFVLKNMFFKNMIFEHNTMIKSNIEYYVWCCSASLVVKSLGTDKKVGGLIPTITYSILMGPLNTI